MLWAATAVAAEDAKNSQVLNSTPIGEDTSSAPTIGASTAVLSSVPHVPRADALVVPLSTPPAPQTDTPVAPATVVPPLGNANTLFASIDELFGDVGGTI
ncbi:unnamed protein product, partial [Ilex paraguariensis]